MYRVVPIDDTQKEDDDSGEDVIASVMAASGLDTHAASSGLTSAAAVDEPAAGLGSQASVVDSTGTGRHGCSARRCTAARAACCSCD